MPQANVSKTYDPIVQIKSVQDFHDRFYKSRSQNLDRIEVSVNFPVDNERTSGWYACKILFNGKAVKKIDICMSMKVTDMPPKHVKCHALKWPKAIPDAKRNASVS